MNEPNYKKEEKPKSIWDETVDFAKVQKLTPEQKAKLFPNDYAPNGEPYGDF